MPFNYTSIYPSIHPSIHPSIYPSTHQSINPSAYLRLGNGGRRLSPVFQTSFSLHQEHFPGLPGGSRGIPIPDGMHNPSIKFWVYPGVPSQLDVPGRFPRGGVRIRCLNQFLMWRSSGSNLKLLQMSKLLPLRA